MKFTGTVWRYIPASGDVLDVGAILSAAGRWNRWEQYGCLYTALTRAGAIAEYEKVRRAYKDFGVPRGRPKDLVSIEVQVHPVLDLTDRRMRRTLGVSLSMITGDDDGDLETCRQLADLARAKGYRAILSPSAALSGSCNLNIYIDGRASDLRIAKGTHRERLPG